MIYLLREARLDDYAHAKIIDPKTESDHTIRITGKIAAYPYQGAIFEYEIAALGKRLKARIVSSKVQLLLERGDEITFSFAAADGGTIMLEMET